MENDKKKILIVGQGAVVSALAKKLRENSEVGGIFVAPGNGISSDIYTNIDYREEDITGLLSFALENDIFLTIPVSEKALKSDIVSFFQSNGQNIFGPVKEACNIATNNVAGKKFIYKIHAQTSKFGIFDKLQQAEDYLRTATFPVTIKVSEYSSIIDDRLVCTTMSLAREFLSTLYQKNEANVLVEEFSYGKNFTIYYITDGYTAVPITSVSNYKFTQDGGGGILTNGIGCYCPDFNISETVYSRVGNIMRNILTSLDKKGCPYVGILGVECTLTGEDKFYVNEFKPFFQEHDARAILNLVEDDLVKIFTSCINGFFSDEYETIRTNYCFSNSVTVLARQNNKIISGLNNIENIEDLDFIKVQKTSDDKYLTVKGPAFTLTRSAGTLSRARKYLYEDLSQIHFDGIKYRKDVSEFLIIE